MKPEYKREDLRLTEFETEDVITTSGITPEPIHSLKELENFYGSYNSFNSTPGSWF